MGTILEILTTNYDGQYANITFYPCSGGSINIGGVILPYNYQSEYYYGTYDIYLPNYDKTCSLNVPCLSPTPTTTSTNTPTITPTPTYTPTTTSTPTPTNTITPTPTTTPIPKDGLSPETAGDNACQIKTDYPSSTDGLYWIKNINISGGTPFQIYADMTTDGGGWTLLVTNQNSAGWTYSNSILLNEFNPVISGSNYSIVAYADYIKGNDSTFRYMLDAYQRNQFGGIWSSPQSYSFVYTANTQTGVTLDTKFGTWNYNDSSIEQRLPWRGISGGILTTSESPTNEYWGSIIGSGFNPSPWINADCGLDGCMPNPGIIWYWVGCPTSLPIPSPTPTPTNTITPTQTPTPTSTPPPLPFISVWRTTTPFESITLPVYNDGSFPSGTINWGDGNVSPNTDGNYTHTYSVAGDYTITISGVMRAWRFVGLPSANNIIEILQWGCFNMGIFTAQFYGCSNLVLTNVTDVPNLTNPTNLNSTFINCTSITTINNINSWDVSSVTDMTAMFNGATSFNQSLASWDVSNVTGMGNMFRNTLFNGNIIGWNVSGVTNMNYMFGGCHDFNQNISGWDVSGVISMDGVFLNNTSFNQDLSSWCVTNIPSLPTNFDNGATSWVLPRPIWGTCPP